MSPEAPLLGFQTSIFFLHLHVVTTSTLVCLFVQISPPYKDPSHMGSGLFIDLILSYLPLQRPTHKYSYLLRYREFIVHIGILRGRHRSVPKKGVGSSMALYSPVRLSGICSWHAWSGPSAGLSRHKFKVLLSCRAPAGCLSSSAVLLRLRLLPFCF